MKFMGKAKGFAAGFIACILLMSAVYAEPLEKTITASFSSIKVFVDGLQIQPKDAGGNPVEPFIVNGTTYLPARAISEALGKTVEWDGVKASVYIGEKPEPGITVVAVSNEKELLAAIGSNKKILLKPGIYNLTQAIADNAFQNEKITKSGVFDGVELILSNIENLTLQGMGAEPPEILVEPRYANVLTFTDAKNISIKNIIAGHTEEKGSCVGGVFVFKDSENISITGSELFGCGTQGLALERVDTLTFRDSVIDDCTYHIMTIRDSENISFTDSKFINNECYEQVKIYNSEVTFDNSEISYNRANTQYNPLFDVNTLSKVIIRNSIIRNNTSAYFMSKRGTVEFQDCLIENNSYNSYYQN